MKIGINIKLTVMCVLLVLIPGLILSIVGYKAAEKAVYSGIDDRLQDQAKDWKILTEKILYENNLREVRVRNSAKNIVTAQAKMAYELIDEALVEQGGTLPPASKEDIFTRFNRNTVGQTGYIWILDYKGNYVLSKGRQRDGENIWGAKDSDGNMVIQDLVRIGKEGKGSEITYHSYLWLNKGESKPREKIAAMIHFPELQWVIGISTYYDDLVDIDFKEKEIEELKNMMADQIIGRSGYIWVVDENGVYVVSKNRLRDGEDISQAKDADGVLFIQEAVKKAKAAGDSTDTQKYPWVNKGESKPRMKVAGLSYVKELGWTIGPSAYYDDFQGEGSLGLVKNNLLIVGFIALLIGAGIAFFVANTISSPIRKMTKAGNDIADGKLDTEIPEIKSHDEVEDLRTTMTLLVGALKFLKGKKK
jgi:signal transduction histidine kinase